jgi:hypothetical protein
MKFMVGREAHGGEGSAHIFRIYHKNWAGSRGRKISAADYDDMQARR